MAQRKDEFYLGRNQGGFLEEATSLLGILCEQSTRGNNLNEDWGGGVYISKQT